MKVFLCQSYLGPKGYHPPLSFPIGLAYIASMIKAQDHDLLCWDPNISSNPVDEFRNLLESFEPDVVGISLRNLYTVSQDGLKRKVHSYYSLFVSMIRMVREILPSCKLVVGGSGFSIFPEEIMRLNAEIDFGVFSEGEYTFPRLLNNLEHPERVKNLFIRHGSSVIFTGRGPYVDFASLPIPLRESFEISKYKDKYCSIGIQTKRGCQFGCIYCPFRYIMGAHYRLRSPRSVVDEIEMLINDYEIETFYFVDSIFNYPPEHGLEICREMNKRKFDVIWEAYFRPDYLTKNYMTEAVKAGCKLFDFSPDGASNESLQILGKDLDVRSISTVSYTHLTLPTKA